MKKDDLFPAIKKYFLLFPLLTLFTPVSVLSQDTARVRSEYLPRIFGILKTKVEHDLDNSLMRFEVRNARFGAVGKINNYMG